MRRLEHVELLVKGPVKKSGANVELSEVVVFNSHNGQKGSDVVKLSNRTESFGVVDLITLSKATGNEASFEPVNISCRVIFDPVGPFAADSFSGGR